VSQLYYATSLGVSQDLLHSTVGWQTARHTVSHPVIIVLCTKLDSWVLLTDDRQSTVDNTWQW